MSSFVGGYRYPAVLSEDETLDKAVLGASIARFGDGEIRLCVTGYAVTQKRDNALVKELRSMLANHCHALVCIPNVRPTPRQRSWLNYVGMNVTSLYKQPSYGSAFISRPDSAPWIDRPDYWTKMRSLWKGQDVTLVRGSDRSLTRDMLHDAKSVREVVGPEVDAFARVNELAEEIGTPSGPVILCLGACATVLAERLARKNVHALDLGHVGMFMRRVEKAAAQ